MKALEKKEEDEADYRVLLENSDNEDYNEFVVESGWNVIEQIEEWSDKARIKTDKLTEKVTNPMEYEPGNLYRLVDQLNRINVVDTDRNGDITGFNSVKYGRELGDAAEELKERRMMLHRMAGEIDRYDVVNKLEEENVHNEQLEKFEKLAEISEGNSFRERDYERNMTKILQDGIGIEVETWEVGKAKDIFEDLGFFSGVEVGLEEEEYETFIRGMSEYQE